MKNGNKIAIYALLFFSASTNYGFNYPSWAQKWAEPVAHAGKKLKDYVGVHDAGKDALEILAKAKSIEANGIEIAKAGAAVATAATTVPTAVGAIKQTADIAQQVNALNSATNALNAATSDMQVIATTLKDALKTTENSATTLQKMQDVATTTGKQLSRYDKLLGAGAIVTIIGGSVHLYCWGKSRLYPKDTEQLKDVLAKDRLEIIRVKKVLMANLALHAYQKRDRLGLPYACKESADKLFMLGGEDELTEAIKQFKQHYGEQEPC